MQTNERADIMRHLTLSVEETLFIGRRLGDLLYREKVFLRQRYTLAQLSEDIQVPLNKLSAFINEHFQMRFNDMINKYRIEYCLKAFGREEWRENKIESIARLSGFNNRNSFSAAFKKFIGISPSEYFSQNYRS
jgi:YesN/AraC family two-component response regulator